MPIFFYIEAWLCAYGLPGGDDMGYKIVYGKRERKKLPVKKYIILSSFVIVTAMMLWPTGRRVLQDSLLPGDAQVTASALETLVFELEQGGGVEKAVTAFCQEIIAGGK